MECHHPYFFSKFFQERIISSLQAKALDFHFVLKPIEKWKNMNEKCHCHWHLKQHSTLETLTVMKTTRKKSRLINKHTAPPYPTHHADIKVYIKNDRNHKNNDKNKNEKKNMEKKNHIITAIPLKNNKPYTHAQFIKYLLA